MTDLVGNDRIKEVKPSRGYQDKQMKDFQSNPATRWIGERMKNGSRSMSTSAKGQFSSMSSRRIRISTTKIVTKDPAYIDMLENRVLPLINGMVDLTDTLAKHIQDLFHADKDISIDRIRAKLGGDFMVKVLEVIKKILKIILTALAKIVMLVKCLANKE